jgi:hypothetical protein
MVRTVLAFTGGMLVVAGLLGVVVAIIGFVSPTSGLKPTATGYVKVTTYPSILDLIVPLTVVVGGWALVKWMVRSSERARVTPSQKDDAHASSSPSRVGAEPPRASRSTRAASPWLLFWGAFLGVVALGVVGAAGYVVGRNTVQPNASAVASPGG